MVFFIGILFFSNGQLVSTMIIIEDFIRKIEIIMHVRQVYFHGPDHKMIRLIWVKRKNDGFIPTPNLN